MKNKQKQQRIEKAVLLYEEVVRFAYSRTKDRAAACDIAQNVMETAVSRIETLRDTDALKRWIMKITSRQITDYFRSMQYEQSHTVSREEEDEEIRELQDVKADILEHVIEQESGELVMKAMLQLDEKYQEIIRYHVIFEWPLTAIAEKLGMNYNTVKIRYIRGIKALRELFLKLEAGGGE